MDGCTLRTNTIWNYRQDISTCRGKMFYYHETIIHLKTSKKQSYSFCKSPLICNTNSASYHLCDHSKELDKTRTAFIEAVRKSPRAWRWDWSSCLCYLPKLFPDWFIQVKFMASMFPRSLTLHDQSMYSGDR